MEVSSKLYKELERIYGYETVNKDPLNDIVLPQSLANIETDNNGLIFRYDYLGDAIEKTNVMKETNQHGKIRLLYVSDMDKYSYYSYNFDKSKKMGKFTWDRFIDDYCDKYLICKELKEKVKNK